MTSQNIYIETMRLKTNSELFLMLENSSEYNSLAIDAIQQVISQRKLSAEEVRQELDIIEEVKLEKKHKANAPLAAQKKAMNFLFPVNGLLQLVSLDKADGYERKVVEANLWAKRGCFFYVIIFIILFAIAGFL